MREDKSCPCVKRPESSRGEHPVAPVGQAVPVVEKSRATPEEAASKLNPSPSDLNQK